MPTFTLFHFSTALLFGFLSSEASSSDLTTLGPGIHSNTPSLTPPLLSSSNLTLPHQNSSNITHSPVIVNPTKNITQPLHLDPKIDVVFPGNEGYDKWAKPYNLRLSYKPVAIAFPKDREEVASLVKAGFEAGVQVCARSGGHSYAAFGLGGRDGALVIDLKNFDKVQLDGPERAFIEPGARVGDVSISLNTLGDRAIPHGLWPLIGFGGHVAFGGIGLASRFWGLTLDNVLEHEVVLANGSITTASETCNPDLFWALRGAGAYFALVTKVTVKTYPVPKQVTNFHLNWVLEDPKHLEFAISAYQNFSLSANLPAELGTIVKISPAKVGNQSAIAFNLTGAYYTSGEAWKPFMDKLKKDLPAPIVETNKTSTYLDSLQDVAGTQPLSSAHFDKTSEHGTYYAKSLTTPRSQPMSEASIKKFAHYCYHHGLQVKEFWLVKMILYGGANSVVDKIDLNATSFAQRDALFVIDFVDMSPNMLPPYPISGYKFLDHMVKSIISQNPPGWAYGAYANFVDDRLSTKQWKAQYWKDHYKRLTQVKAAYDPQDVFSGPQSITEK